MSLVDNLESIQMKRRYLLIKFKQGDITLEQFKSNIISLQDVEKELLNK